MPLRHTIIRVCIYHCRWLHLNEVSESCTVTVVIFMFLCVCVCVCVHV